MTFIIYILRHDLRVADSPILHAISQSTKFTHLVPIFVLTPHQIEVSGLASSRSPYPEARSRLGNFWRCGPHRVKFLSEAVYDVKRSLQELGSDLLIRVGPLDVVLSRLLQSQPFKDRRGAVWMTRDWATEEMSEEQRVRRVVEDANVDWKVWNGEDTLIHEADLPARCSELPDVFTSFRKSVEPLRDHIRKPYPTPPKLPPVPDNISPQHAPFEVPSTLSGLTAALLKPLGKVPLPPNFSAHPFIGGEGPALSRVMHLLSSGSMTMYKDTRNGLVGQDFSTKLSGYLALGCITARQINEYLMAFEDGCLEGATGAQGYGKGENKGTAAVRFELLWRDYMRLCMRKYGSALFSVYGFRGRTQHSQGFDKQVWKSPSHDAQTAEAFERFLNGTTGVGLIDASMRELAATGYTSNRARQNCASFLATWLGIDWRLGAEWYESMLVDYDVSNNWGNWQYVAGVGNDPRASGQGPRRFNPVKQAWDYDKKGDYVKMWVDELANVGDLNVVFQAWRINEGKKKGSGSDSDSLKDLTMVKDPLVRIAYNRKYRAL